MFRNAEDGFSSTTIFPAERSILGIKQKLHVTSQWLGTDGLMVTSNDSLQIREKAAVLTDIATFGRQNKKEVLVKNQMIGILSI